MNSQDNFVALGKTLQEHDERLAKAFLKIREIGLKLNKTKCQIRKQLIVFLGHITLSADIKADPPKTEVITKMPFPNHLMNYRDFLIWLTT